MHITVLGASGATGRLLTQQALDRGRTVVAVARNIDRIAVPDSPGLTKVSGDVFDAQSNHHSEDAHEWGNSLSPAQSVKALGVDAHLRSTVICASD